MYNTEKMKLNKDRSETKRPQVPQEDKSFKKDQKADHQKKVFTELNSYPEKTRQKENHKTKVTKKTSLKGSKMKN